jgi:hypothetical protein
MTRISFLHPLLTTPFSIGSTIFTYFSVQANNSSQRYALSSKLILISKSTKNVFAFRLTLGLSPVAGEERKVCDKVKITFHC